MPTPRTKRTTTGSTFIHETNLASLSIIPHSAVAIVEQQYFMLSLLLSPFLRNLTVNFDLINKATQHPSFLTETLHSQCVVWSSQHHSSILSCLFNVSSDKENATWFSASIRQYRLLLLFSMEDMIEWQILAKKSRLTAGECILHTAQLRSLYSFHTAESAVQTTQLTEHGTVCSSHGTFK